MRQTKVIFLTVVLTLMALGTVVYTSCRKDHCKTLNCLNGSVCQDGFCICPTGYTGTYCQNANVSNINMRNETFTTVSMLIEGNIYKVDSGDILTFTGSYGDTLKGSATTHGLYGLNVSLGSFKIIFPPRNTATYDLDVSPDYFFLMVADSNATVPELTKVYVNYQQRDSTLDIVTKPVPIQYDGLIHHIGYFKMHSDTKVRLELDPSHYWTYNVGTTTPTKNQYFKAVIK